jgi:hypothetical protein
MKYMILVNASQQDYDEMARWSPADFAAMGQFMEQFSKELTESGELVDTCGLTSPAQARRIQGRGSEAVITDGPYAETQEVLAGYWIVECESFDRATEIAARLTRTPGPGNAERGYADVRPIAGSRDDL